MHKYLRSIGYSRITKRELDALLYEIRRDPDYHDTAIDIDGNKFEELRREIAPGMGLAVRGHYKEDGQFHTDYYFPYRYGREVSVKEPTEIIRESERESYLGFSEDIRVGVDLIYFVQDMLSILESDQRQKKVVDFGGTVLSALSAGGKILLPVYATQKQTANAKKISAKRRELLTAARDGDNDAFDQLTLDDMDTYAMISKRIEREDILSIVNSYFMPEGIESDKYSILGEILEHKKAVNHHTAEIIHIFKIDCNGIVFDVAINGRDLLGEPAVGRRFKGDVWMQGKVMPY